MEFVELRLTGLKTTYMIAPSLLPLTILNRAMKRWVHSYFYFILMTCQTALRNYHLEFFGWADTNVFYTSDKLQHLETVMNEELKISF